MAKYPINHPVFHSRRGHGKVTAVGTRTETPAPFDAVKLDGEKWNLIARLAEIEAIKERGTEPREVPVYEVTYEETREVKLPGGKTEVVPYKHTDLSELAIDKLTERRDEALKAPPPDAPADPSS